MSGKPILYGFDGSTYVRTVRILLREKGADYEQVPVNVLAGEPRQPEHLARHPFGKVPVMDIDGMRIRETDAICRYLDETLAGPSFVADTPKGRARMNEAICLINSYGYNALVGVAGYHLFPDLIGGANDEARQAALKESEKLLGLLMTEIKGDDPWLAGTEPSLADFLLGPIFFYVSLTPDAERLLAVPGVADWWERIKEVESFKATEPDLG
ncbi:MAG: glutathione S-transferase family protein [Kiloniellales bacterium]|nr:glutathione S-transferase family protein [Kiloniellales bacterium]